MKLKAWNMRSKSGNKVINQIIIETSIGIYFQSYNTVIAFVPIIDGNLFENGKIKLDKNGWDYSRTTGKYRNIFLGETKRETERKIADGTYELVDLNIGE